MCMCSFGLLLKPVPHQELLMTKILHDLVYQSPRNYGSEADMGSSRILIINWKCSQVFDNLARRQQHGSRLLRGSSPGSPPLSPRP